MSKLEYIRDKFRKAVDNGREYTADYIVEIYYNSDDYTECTGCEWDPVTKESTDPNCPLCSGTYRIYTTKKLTVKANASWRGYTDEYTWVRLTGGRLPIGDVIVTCKRTDILVNQSNPTGQTYFEIANYILVNGIRCKMLTTPMPYGLAGDLYSCAVVLVKDEN